METMTLNGQTFTKTSENSAWFSRRSFSPEFYRTQSERSLAFLNAGLNPIVAEKYYNQSQYEYYKAASISCTSYNSLPSSPTTSNVAYSTTSPFSSSREIRFTRLIV